MSFNPQKDKNYIKQRELYVPIPNEYHHSVFVNVFISLWDKEKKEVVVYANAELCKKIIIGNAKAPRKIKINLVEQLVDEIYFYQGIKPKALIEIILNKSS